MCDLWHGLKLFESSKTCFFCTSLIFQACVEACACNRSPYMLKPEAKQEMSKRLKSQLQFFFFFSSKHVVFFLLGFSINLKPHWSRLLFPSLQTILNGDRGCFCLCKYAPKVIFLVAAHVLNCTFLKSFCVQNKINEMM